MARDFSTRIGLLLALALASSGCGRLTGADQIVLDRCATNDCTAPDDGVRCADHRDCALSFPDEPHVCRNERCVALRNDHLDVAGAPGACSVVLGADNLRSGVPPYVFGALSVIPQSDPESGFATTNYDFALHEFTRKGGLPIGGETRLPVAVVCDVQEATELSLERTFEHLTGDLGITGVLAPLPAAELKRTFEYVHADLNRSVFFLSPFASDPLLAAMDDDGLVWHLLGDPREIARVYPPLLRRVEDYVNPAPPQGLRPPIRLSLVNTDASVEADTAASIDRELVLNGRTATENGDEFYRRHALKSGSDASASYQAVLGELVEFRPHVIVAIAASEFVSMVMRPLELGWRHVAADQPPPFYVMSPSQIASTKLRELMTEVPDLQERVIGVNVAGAEDTRVYDAYLRAIQSEYRDRENLESTENFYDAAYFLLYASAAADAADRDGKSVADSMRRLTAGPSFDVGGLHIPDVLEHLATPDGSVRLNGALGPPDFDLATGAHAGAGSVWCVDERDFAFVFDVLRLDGDGALYGDFKCFPGF